MSDLTVMVLGAPLTQDEIELIRAHREEAAFQEWWDRQGFAEPPDARGYAKRAWLGRATVQGAAPYIAGLRQGYNIGHARDHARLLRAIESAQAAS